MPGETFIGSPWRQPYTAQQLAATAANQVPIVGGNGHWFTWDIDVSDWHDTGVTAATSLMNGSVTWDKLSAQAQLNHGNLLLNFDFRQPVNRNGKTEYTGAGFTIDKWKIQPRLSLTVNSDYITLKKTIFSGNPYLYCPVESISKLVGKTVTASILYRSNCSPRLIGNPNGGNQAVMIPISADWNLCAITFVIDGNASPADSAFWVQMMAGITNEDNFIDLKACKLDLGDQQTLAHQDEDGNWVLNDPPNYDLQYLLTSLYSPTTGEWVGIQHSNDNLLDNWYFIGGGSQQGGGQFPVNQRGLTEYTGVGYTIDRWHISDGGKLVLNDDYITFSGQSSAGYDNLRQTIEPSKFRGLNLVFSVLYRSSTTDWLIVAKRIGLSDISVDLLNTQGEFKLATLNVTVNSTSDTGYFAIMRKTVGAQSNIDIIAAKLELGPYQTLAYESGGGGGS